MNIIKKNITPGSIIVTLLLVVYTALTFLTPQTPTSEEQLQISEAALFWIRASIVFVYALVWYAALYSIRSLKVGDMKKIFPESFVASFALGFVLLLAGLLGGTLIQAIKGYSAVFSDQFTAPLTILVNYVHVVFPLLAFFFMWKGISVLKNEQRPLRLESSTVDYFTRAIVPIFFVALLYIPLVFTNTNRQIPYTTDTSASYYISDPLILLTLVLPALIAWTIGIAVSIKLSDKLMALNISNVSTLTNGILLVIFSSIFLQALLSLGTERLYELGLGLILLLVYVLIFVQLAGFLLTAKGIRTLQKD